MVAVFSEIFNMSQWTKWFENSPYFHKYSNMAFIEPMHRNKPNITYLLHKYSTDLHV